ncbi:hypothetical protein N9K98_07165 [Luminiphilus sp.]|nr:hypothetical protein [Luminiphilus sp.]
MSDFPGLTISCPLFFNSDESIDFETLERYLDNVCQNKNISAVYSMAYNTRYRMLRDDELLEVNAFVIKKVKSFGHSVYVGHPYVFTRSSLDKYLSSIANLKPSGVSMLYPERYYGLDDFVIEFLRAPFHHGIDVVLHEMKLVSGFDGSLVDWPVQLLERVFDEVPLVAVKEDSKSDEIALRVLELCKQKGVHFVLAGGGKVRALKFLDKGMTTWLNGSTMFLPQLIDRTYTAFVAGDKTYQAQYLDTIEKPFFEAVVSKHGWHLAHKAALEFFGYGERFERFPHARMSNASYASVKPTLEQISVSSRDI